MGEGGPLGDLSVNMMPTLATSAPGYDGQPVLELCLCKPRPLTTLTHYCTSYPTACSSLLGSMSPGGLPSTFIITEYMTPPQAYWIRYAQTEVVEVSGCGQGCGYV